MPLPFSLLPPGGDERRRTPRYLVPPGSPLVVGVVVRDAAGKALTFTGRARDVSRSGMAIVLPPGEACGELVGNSRSLLAVVSLPSGVIRLTAAPVYCHPPDEGQTERGYIVGVRFTEISEHDQTLLDEYLGGLA
jgi:c-di-GMP-binding flagellar brake protein YcgR